MIFLESQSELNGSFRIPCCKFVSIYKHMLGIFFVIKSRISDICTNLIFNRAVRPALNQEMTIVTPAHE